MPAPKSGLTIVPLWISVIVASITVVLLSAWLAQNGIKELNDIIDPCLHGGIYNKTNGTLV